MIKALNTKKIRIIERFNDGDKLLVNDRYLVDILIVILNMN